MEHRNLKGKEKIDNKSSSSSERVKDFLRIQRDSNEQLKEVKNELKKLQEKNRSIDEEMNNYFESNKTATATKQKLKDVEYHRFTTYAELNNQYIECIKQVIDIFKQQNSYKAYSIEKKLQGKCH